MQTPGKRNSGLISYSIAFDDFVQDGGEATSSFEVRASRFFAGPFNVRCSMVVVVNRLKVGLTRQGEKTVACL
jgi:hypothetical protein